MLEINSYEKQLNGLLIEREELFEQINELKNKIEQQEIMIDKMKKIIIFSAHETDFNPCFCCDNIDFYKQSRCKINGCTKYDKWQLKNE